MGRRARLEKLQDNLAKVTDGRKLRSIVREMIRQGGQRVLHRLESTPIPLEPWMCEVLVNCCHLEIRLEEAEKRLRPLQRRALQPLKDEVKKMTNMPKEKRFDRLCTWTWDSIKDNQGPPDKGNPIMESNPWRKPPRLDLGQRDRKATPKADENNLPASLRSGRSGHQADSSDEDEPPARPRFAAEEDDVFTSDYVYASTCERDCECRSSLPSKSWSPFRTSSRTRGRTRLQPSAIAYARRRK